MATWRGRQSLIGHHLHTQSQIKDDEEPETPQDLVLPANNSEIKVGPPSYFADFATGTDGRITVTGPEGYPQIGIIGQSGSNGSLSFRSGQGTLMEPEPSQDGDGLGIIEFYGMDIAGVSSPASSIEAYVDGDPTNPYRVPGSLNFYVDNGTTPSLRFQLRADGNVVLPTLPTADPHVAGALWSNSGVVTLSSG